jgi:CRP/FNR family transcriptional regulator
VRGDELRRVPLFRDLPPERLAEIARRCPQRAVRAGTVLVRAGDPATAVIILASGQLTAVHHSAAGTTVRPASAGAPSVIDKAAVLSGGPHPTNWCALTDCTIRVMDRAFFVRLLDTEPALRRHVMRHISREVIESRRDRIRVETLSSRARVARWILDRSDRHGGVIPLPGGQEALAEELGLSRVTVNRALQALVRCGAARVRRGSLEVRDAVALAATVENTAAR